MPKANGIEILKKVKSSLQKNHISVVVLLSSKEECDIVESYQLGVNAYSVKPVDFQKFAYAIAQIGFWLVLKPGAG